MQNLLLRFSLVLATAISFHVLTVTAWENDRQVKFQDQDWVVQDSQSLLSTTLHGREGLQWIPPGPDEVAYLAGSAFRRGTIEMELAVVGRSYPTIAFGVSATSQQCDQVTLVPHRNSLDSARGKFRQGVVTKLNGYTSVVVHFNHESCIPDDWNGWFRVRIEVQDDLCQLFIDDDQRASFVWLNDFDFCRGSLIGLADQACFVRNIVVSPEALDDSSASIP